MTNTGFTACRLLAAFATRPRLYCGARRSTYKDISYADLKALLGKSDSLLVVDVRTKEEVDKGHIQGSIHIPVDTVESALALDPAEFKARYGVSKPPLDAPQLVFHCQMGRRGATATEKARDLGFQKARNYAGGYKEWSEKEGN